MNIRKLVERLEEIEASCNGKARDLCWDLINELIEIDLEMENKVRKVIGRGIEEDFIKFLMTEGIASGSIGEA
tara:strand:- start:3576 stop:3794 length:219 start_codon:yes stop_codon:yes gene_type:complete